MTDRNNDPDYQKQMRDTLSPPKLCEMGHVHRAENTRPRRVATKWGDVIVQYADWRHDPTMPSPSEALHIITQKLLNPWVPEAAKRPSLDSGHCPYGESNAHDFDTTPDGSAIYCHECGEVRPLGGRAGAPEKNQP